MLVFDPSKRISVTEALQHPYMSPLYDPNSNPPAQVPIDLDMVEDLGEEMIREMMWKEIDAAAAKFTIYMDSSSENSPGSSLLQNSGSEEDQSKRNREQSNRESIRRSRLRKQRHIDDLTQQVSLLRRDNDQLLTNINIATQQLITVQTENSILKALIYLLISSGRD
ncbi:hypothetical protein Q3G72_033722 [Acer saccharum]|nr:hypothetical protein Q3G72_033722 [Acer saccharum]